MHDIESNEDDHEEDVPSEIGQNDNEDYELNNMLGSGLSPLSMACSVFFGWCFSVSLLS